MNYVKVFRILEQSGFSKENAELFLDELKEQDTNLATKADLLELKIEIMKEFKTVDDKFDNVSAQLLAMTREINQLTFRIIGTVIGLLSVFKLGDIWLKSKGF